MSQIMASSDEQEVEEQFNTLEKSDATLDAWDFLLDDPYCEYHGLDKVSAIDILVEYEKKSVPKGYYTVDEYDAFYNIACILYDHSRLKLHFKTLFNTIVSLQELYYPVYPTLNLKRFYFFDDAFIIKRFQT